METEWIAATVGRATALLLRKIQGTIPLALLLGLMMAGTGFLRPCPAWTAGKATAADLIIRGGYLVDDGTGTRQYRAREPFIPASTLKVLTCLAALETLGPDYRFETRLYSDDRDNLYIKGYGDPFLTSETVSDIGRQLYAAGVRRVATIFLDDSVFAIDGPAAGSENSVNSYDAPNGALAVNFNSLPVRVEDNGTIDSGEPQTPSLPLMQEIGPRLPAGSHRVNLTAFPCLPPLSTTLRYTGELFAAQLKEAGIVVDNICFQAKAVTRHLAPRLIYRNPLPLSEIIRACLKQSNNFIANQLFLACGMQAFGAPASWQKSQAFFAEYREKVLQIAPTELRMVEGSGLSRENRITAAALVRVLHRFSPFSELLPPHDGILLKTGTMHDIFCYAGYLDENKQQVPFAILLNQEKNNRKEILELLRQIPTKTAAPPSHPAHESEGENVNPGIPAFPGSFAGGSK